MAHLVSESDNIGPKPGPGSAGPAPGLDALSALSTCPLAARGPLVPRLRNSVPGDGITAGLE